MFPSNDFTPGKQEHLKRNFHRHEKSNCWTFFWFILFCQMWCFSVLKWVLRFWIETSHRVERDRRESHGLLFSAYPVGCGATGSRRQQRAIGAAASAQRHSRLTTSRPSPLISSRTGSLSSGIRQASSFEILTNASFFNLTIVSGRTVWSIIRWNVIGIYLFFNSYDGFESAIFPQSQSIWILRKTQEETQTPQLL